MKPFPPVPKGDSLDWPALSRWLLAMETWGAGIDKRVLVLEDADGGTAIDADGAALHSFMHAGGSGWTSWRLAGSQNNQGASGIALTANQLRAVPFVAPRGAVTLTAMGFEVTTGLAGNARCGLYSNKGDRNLYPDQLLVDGGQFTTNAAGVKNSTALSVSITAGLLYWLVHVQDVAAATRVVTAPTDVLGHSNDTFGNIYMDLRVAFTYAALPATFPSGAQPDTNTATTTTAVPALYFQVAA